MRSVSGVFDVVRVDDSDGTVCEAIERERPGYFANGGDRTDKNTPETELCMRLGVGLLWGVGGEKIASSSDMVKNCRERVVKSWGTYEVLAVGDGYKVKLLTLNPYPARTSFQRHAHREEHWIILGPANVSFGELKEDTKFMGGGYHHVERGAWHRLASAHGSEPLRVIEVQVGEACDEDDIERAIERQ